MSMYSCIHVLNYTPTLQYISYWNPFVVLLCMTSYFLSILGTRVPMYLCTRASEYPKTKLPQFPDIRVLYPVITMSIAWQT